MIGFAFLAIITFFVVNNNLMNFDFFMEPYGPNKKVSVQKIMNDYLLETDWKRMRTKRAASDFDSLTE